MNRLLVRVIVLPFFLAVNAGFSAQRSGVRPSGVNPSGVNPSGVNPLGVRPSVAEPTNVAAELTPRRQWLRKAGAIAGEIRSPATQASAWAEIAVEEHAGGDELMAAGAALACTGAVGLAEAGGTPTERVLAITSMIGASTALGDKDGVRTRVELLLKRVRGEGVAAEALGEAVRTLAAAGEIDAALTAAKAIGDPAARTLALAEAASLAGTKADSRALADAARKGIDGRAGDASDVFTANVISKLVEAALATGDTRFAGLLSGAVRVPEYRVKSDLALARAAAEKGDGEACQKHMAHAAQALEGCVFAKARYTAEIGSLLADLGAEDQARGSLKRFDAEHSEAPAGLLIAAEVAAKLGDSEADRVLSAKVAKTPGDGKADLAAEWLRVAQARAGARDGFRAIIAANEVVGPESARYRPSAFYAAGKGLQRMGLTDTHRKYMDLILEPEDCVFVAIGIAAAMREDAAKVAGATLPTTLPEGTPGSTSPAVRP